MRHLFILLSLILFILFSSISAYADNDNIIKFKLEIKPNQQKVEAKIDGDEHKQIQIRAEYVKLNPVTNNYHIKVTITNNSGQILYHQLALIDKVEHADVKYSDGTTNYIKNDDGKQITKTLPYYNYGNIKANQATPREWYLSNTGKDEIEVEGYIISKEIPIVLNMAQIPDPALAATLTTYYSALRDNDLDLLLTTVPKHFSREDLIAKYTEPYNLYPGVFPQTFPYISNPTKVVIMGGTCFIHYKWLSPDDGVIYEGGLQLQKSPTNKWLITK